MNKFSSLSRGIWLIKKKTQLLKKDNYWICKNKGQRAINRCSISVSVPEYESKSAMERLVHTCNVQEPYVQFQVRQIVHED